jgi:hypothetical protein
VKRFSDFAEEEGPLEGGKGLNPFLLKVHFYQLTHQANHQYRHGHNDKPDATHSEK